VKAAFRSGSTWIVIFVWAIPASFDKEQSSAYHDSRSDPNGLHARGRRTVFYARRFHPHGELSI
jgi:hypothetical protein